MNVSLCNNTKTHVMNKYAQAHTYTKNILIYAKTNLINTVLRIYSNAF